MKKSFKASTSKFLNLEVYIKDKPHQSNGRDKSVWYNMCMPVNWSARRYTKEEFILAWEESKSIADVLRVLNIVPAGGNYQSLNSAAKELGLTKSHMTGQGWNKGGVGTNKGKELDLILVKGSSLSSHNIRKRLIKEGWKGARCEVCKLEEWMGA